eukprot:247035_1
METSIRTCIEPEWVYIVATIISLLGVTPVIWFIHQFVKARDTLKADKRLYTSVLVFFILIAIACISATISTIMSWLGRLGFTFQLAMILWLLFYRLNRVFEGSTFALEHRTKWLFRVTYLLLIGGELSVVVLLATPLHRSIGTTIVMGSVFFCAFVYITALVSLMVCKLITIAKHEKLIDKDQSMVPIVTKVFILSLTPIIAIFWIGLSAVMDNVLHMHGTSTRLLQVTNFTVALCANFYSMLFGFNHFMSPML